MRILYVLPFIIFLGIAIILWRGLGLHPAEVPSPLINKPAPEFNLPSLLDKTPASNKDLLGHVTLVNVWASWCYACAEEHAFLVELAKNKAIVLYGLNYKDDPATAKALLQKQGNPYQKIAVDQDGSAAINWGVYGAPETFIVDKQGVIRYKYIGPLSESVWQRKLNPLIEKLQ